MSLVEEYYELNEAEEVSPVWKILQIGLYGSASVFGLACGFVLGTLRLKFDDRCYLFTDVRLSLKDGKPDQNNINWESDTWCDFYQFSMVSSFIVGIIWGTLFLMCGKGGKSLTGFVCNMTGAIIILLPQPWRIVWPSMIFNFIYFSIILFTAVGIQRGTDHFCERQDFGKKFATKPLMESCDSVKLLIKKDLYLILLQIQIVEKTSWGCAFFWFVLFLLSFFRIVFIVDFQIHKICVFKIDETVQNKKEEVLRITNYEEPKKLHLSKSIDGKTLSTEYIPHDLDMGERKRVKVEKKAAKQQLSVSIQFPHRPNAVFYDAVDLRMLNRDKKRKKSSKVLDEAFRQSKFSPRVGNSHVPTFLCQYAPEFFNEGDEDDEGSFSNVQKEDHPEDADESGSESEAPESDHDSDNLVKSESER